MPLPQNPEIANALVDLLVKEGEPYELLVADVYQLLAKRFKLTDEQLGLTTYSGRSLWKNRVRTANARLKDSGILSISARHGFCILTRIPAEHTEKWKTVVTSDLEALEDEEQHLEGGRKKRYTYHYERNPNLRTEAILIHGTKCKACGLDFEKVYGERGSDFIEVHHLKPLSQIGEEASVDPRNDLVVVCANCHRMIHRKRNDILSLEHLTQMIHPEFLNSISLLS